MTPSLFLTILMQVFSVGIWQQWASASQAAIFSMTCRFVVIWVSMPRPLPLSAAWLAKQQIPAPCLAGGVPIWQQLHAALWAAVQSQTLKVIQAPLPGQAPADGLILSSPGEFGHSKGCRYLGVLTSLLAWPPPGTNLETHSQQQQQLPGLWRNPNPSTTTRWISEGSPKKSKRTWLPCFTCCHGYLNPDKSGWIWIPRQK